MSKSTWVCFNCKSTVRREKFARDMSLIETPTCSVCGHPRVDIGYRIPVPPKRDGKAWDELRKHLEAQDIAFAAARYAQRTRDRHDLEREIRRIQALPENKGRSQMIRQLQRRLDRISR